MVDIQAILQRAYDYGITYIDKGVVANRALTYMLLNGKIISPDINVEDLLNVYFKSCSILANVTDLAQLSFILSRDGKDTAGKQRCSAEHASVTPWIIGAVLAAMTCYCLLGGGKRILKVTSVLVPIMGAIYVLVSLVMVVMNITATPAIFARIFADAFNFKAIFGGVAGS